MDFLKELWQAYSFKIIMSLVVFAGFLLLAYLLAYILKKIAERQTDNKCEILHLIAGSQKTILIVVGFISALGTLGVNVSALVAGLGLTGFAIGLALKDAISNLVAGIMIVFYRPFEIRDDINLDGAKGEVLAINLRYITVRSETEDVLVPNSLFLSKKIHLKRNES